MHSPMPYRIVRAVREPAPRRLATATILLSRKPVPEALKGETSGCHFANTGWPIHPGTRRTSRLPPHATTGRCRAWAFRHTARSRCAGRPIGNRPDRSRSRIRNLMFAKSRLPETIEPGKYPHGRRRHFSPFTSLARPVGTRRRTPGAHDRPGWSPAFNARAQRIPQRDRGGRPAASTGISATGEQTWDRRRAGSLHWPPRPY